LVLGIALTTSVVLAPQRIYGWLGIVSGVLLAAVGASLLRRAWRSRRTGQWLGHHHHHPHGAGHSHDHVHEPRNGSVVQGDKYDDHHSDDHEHLHNHNQTVNGGDEHIHELAAAHDQATDAAGHAHPHAGPHAHAEAGDHDLAGVHGPRSGHAHPTNHAHSAAGESRQADAELARSELAVSRATAGELPAESAADDASAHETAEELLGDPDASELLVHRGVAPAASTSPVVGYAPDHLQGDAITSDDVTYYAHTQGDVRPRGDDRVRSHEADYLRARLHGYEHAANRAPVGLLVRPPVGARGGPEPDLRTADRAGLARTATSAGLGLRSLIAMGFAGGLVPSPSALVVLLGAVALGRTWFGVLLVIGYGAGMACTLTGVGFALARWRSVIDRRLAGRVGGLFKGVMPVVTASLIVVVGCGVAAQAALLLGG
jgi:hypothetical protein